ncbi:MAG: hypothetical protein QOH58_2457 [Thermoleophilaceae bacterium]|jgi:hypothetical protein|nr:hypothetical protein [Thermoleophilaceae bacterium]
MFRLPTALAALIAALVLAPAALAASEEGDAGDLPLTAQDLSGASVDRIDGSLADGSDIDVYRLCLAGGGSFSASTVGSSAVDTQLFLFDVHGFGVYANDDSDATSQSRLPAGHALTPLAGGIYHLAVTPYNRDPEGALGPLFPDLPDVTGPLGLPALAIVGAWTGRPGDSGDYTIQLTGAACAAPDTTAPTVDLRSPLDGATVALGAAVEVDYSCADEAGGSGLASCVGTPADGSLLDTSQHGPVSATVTAVDNAGNQTVVTHTVNVGLDFGGFSRPVRNRPSVNKWRAGSSVPIRFSLGGDQGLDVIAEGWPQVAEIECGSGAEADTGAPARRSALVYSSRWQRYGFYWKTDRRWAGSCRQLLLKLSDGSVKRADFRFARHRH